jgi:hypothetical protein
LLRWRRFAGNTIAGDTVLNRDFKEFIQSLNDNGVRYLVIDGYAVAFHGHPSYSKDIAIWVGMEAGNAANITKALEQFGFASLGLQAVGLILAAPLKFFSVLY